MSGFPNRAFGSRHFACGLSPVNELIFWKADFSWALTVACRVCSLASHFNMRSSDAIPSKETFTGRRLAFWLFSSRNIFESWICHHSRLLYTNRFPGASYPVLAVRDAYPARSFSHHFPLLTGYCSTTVI